MGARHRSFWPDDMHTKVLDNQPTLYDHTAIFFSSIFFVSLPILPDLWHIFF